MSRITSRLEYDAIWPTVSPEMWRDNVVTVAERIGNSKHQEKHWFRDDRPPWENPIELICSLDDVVFDQFLENCAFSFTDQQVQAVQDFSLKLRLFESESQCANLELDSWEVFHSPLWQDLSQAARRLVAAFAVSTPQF